MRGLTQLGSIGKLIRHHGDYHLGQVLWASEDWLVIDFEGEPARSLAERRAKRSPLRDVAGMLRSFNYAAAVAGIPGSPVEDAARAEFLAGYDDAIAGSGLLAGADATERLLRIFELEKVVYELRYELANRPDWVSVPVGGILRLLEARRLVGFATASSAGGTSRRRRITTSAPDAAAARTTAIPASTSRPGELPAAAAEAETYATGSAPQGHEDARAAGAAATAAAAAGREAEIPRARSSSRKTIFASSRHAGRRGAGATGFGAVTGPGRGQRWR